MVKSLKMADFALGIKKAKVDFRSFLPKSINCANRHRHFLINGE
jgi:hypothetical protein